MVGTYTIHRALLFGTTINLAFLLFLLPIAEQSLAQAPEVNPHSQLNREAVHLLGGNLNLSVRWENEVRYLVVESEASNTHTMVDDIFSGLSALTAITSRRVENPYPGATGYLDALQRTPAYNIIDCANFRIDNCPNFVVVVADQQTMHEISVTMPMRAVIQRATGKPDAVLCFFSPGVSSDRIIHRGFVYIDQALDEVMLRTCLQEEIYQSFGLFNDYTNSQFFSFNNVTRPKSITAYDRALLSSLYDNQFPAGTVVNLIASHMVSTQVNNDKSIIAEAP